MASSKSSKSVASGPLRSKFVFLQDEPHVVVAAIFIALAILALYWRTLDNEIVFDTAQSFGDPILIDYLEKFDIFNVRGLSKLTFGLTYLFAKTDWWWHRLINMLIHMGNSVLVFLFMRGLFFEAIHDDTKEALPVHTSWIAFFVGLMFAVSPINVYGTAYLIQRFGQMATLFVLLALMAFRQGFYAEDKKKQIGYFLLTGVLYFVALHSKEHCVMFPAILGMYILILEPFDLKGFLNKYGWFFALLALIGLESVFRAKGILGEVYEPHGEQMIRSANIKETVLSEDSAYTLSLITQANMFFRYIYLWFVPDLRNIFIDIHLPFATKFVSWPETLFVVMFIGYPILAVWLFIKGGLRRLVGFAMLAPWFFFWTELSLVRLSEQFVLYRSYIWMSLIGAIFPFFYALHFDRKFFPNLKIGLTAFYILILTFAAYDRIGSFENKIVLWQDVVQKMKSADKSALYKGYRPYNNLAFALTSAGKLEESIPYYYQAIQINPKYVKALSNLGAVLTNRGRFQEAIEYFKKAISIDPEYVDAHVGLGVCAAEQGFNEEAIEHYRNALKAKPDYPDALFNMGNAYLKLKQYQSAADLYKKAIEKKPNFADSHHNLGIAYSHLGNIVEAKKAFEGAIKIKPDHKKSREALNIINNRIFTHQKVRTN